MNAKIKSIIKQYAKEKSFTYVNADDDMIKIAEKELNVLLPQEYKEFLIQ